MSTPKAFISHSKLDKDRFVRSFAKQLRENGVDAWVDEWELALGDSLIDKIYEEGIKNADVFIIVLSEESVQSRWVREELNAAVVKRISRGAKIIPIILDSCEVPECLLDTVWIKINNINDYTSEFEKIIDSIFKYKDRPQLGDPPSYTTSPSPSVLGLQKPDISVLQAFCEVAIDHGYAEVISTNSVWENLESQGMAKTIYLESLEILSLNGYLKKSKTLSRIPRDCSITQYGFSIYCQHFVKDHKEIVRSVISQLVNQKVYDRDEIASNIDKPKLFVTMALRNFKNRKLIMASEYSGGGMSVHDVSPALKRMLEN